MQKIYKKITKEEYDRYSAMSYGELNKEVEDGLGDHIKYGYGYYGCSLYASKDGYKLVMEIGDSCD